MFGLEREQVPMPTRLQAPVTERLAELRDVNVDAIDRARGRVFVPKRVDQPVCGDDLARTQEKECEQRPLFACADLERLPTLGHLERAKDAEFHRVVTTGQAASFPASQVLHKRNSSTAQPHQPTLGLIALAREVGLSIKRGLRWFVVLALLLLVAAASSHGADTNPPPDPSRDRPSTVVVSVRDDGFHWTDAGVGAAATLATMLLALGLVLAIRPDRGGNGKP